MKLSLAALLAVTVSAAPRRLDQNQQAEEYDETSFLKNYEQVFLKCIPGMKVMNEQGEYDYNAVVYRMCPSGNACDSKGKVCSEGYGDYVVGLQEYVRGFFDQFEDEEDQYQQEQAYDFGEFGECREINVEANDDGNGQQAVYYMGPACTSDGDVRMALFKNDQYCRPEYEAEEKLEDLIGIEMPYENGGLMDDDECSAYYCNAMNDNGEYELNRFCEELYMNSAYKCEQEMTYVSAVNGMNNNGCEAIAEMMPAKSKGGKGGTIFLIILLVAAVVGVAVYFVMSQKKKKSGTSEGLMM